MSASALTVIGRELQRHEGGDDAEAFRCPCGWAYDGTGKKHRRHVARAVRDALASAGLLMRS